MMSNLGVDLFDPRSAVMDSDLIPSPTRGPDMDFGFAFNDSNFSDRLLRIEIVSDSRAEFEVCQTLADWAATRKSKRHRGDIVKKDTVLGGSTVIKSIAETTQKPNHYT